jgi:hypothetical protein
MYLNLGKEAKIDLKLSHYKTGPKDIRHTNEEGM